MAQDFTILNFGWWTYYDEMMPDMYEYGTSLAYSWDCPATTMFRLPNLASNPRTKDNLEVLRRWEVARERAILTEEEKLALRNTKQEHILLINEEGEYELCAYDRVTDAANGNTDLTAYVLNRKGKSYAVLWHTKGTGTLTLPLSAKDLLYEAELGKEQLALTETPHGTSLVVSDRHYLSTNLSREALITALRAATLN